MAYALLFSQKSNDELPLKIINNLKYYEVAGTEKKYNLINLQNFVNFGRQSHVESRQ